MFDLALTWCMKDFRMSFILFLPPLSPNLTTSYSLGRHSVACGSTDVSFPHVHVTTTGAPLNNFSCRQPVIWAVTDVNAVPSGSILINPQNGEIVVVVVVVVVGRKLVTKVIVFR